MTIASLDLRSPMPIAASAAGFPFLADLALSRAASAGAQDAAREELEQRRWQLEWERRNVED